MHYGSSSSGEASADFISLAKNNVEPFGGRQSVARSSGRGHYGPPKSIATIRPFPVGAKDKADNEEDAITGQKRHRVVTLHREIDDFFHWILPTRHEHEVRTSVVERVKASIMSVFPDSRIEVFGSSRTGLYLPTSDIDLVVYGKWESMPFSSICGALMKRNVCMPGSLKVLERATVPIIKLADRMTGFPIDISFNLVNGLRAAELIKFYKGQYPAMAKLVYVLKQFLYQRNLSEVYSGGLSSYALILMVVSFLQRHNRCDARSNKTNLGVLLVEFFELYGLYFNYGHNAIRVEGGGAYVRKEDLECYQGQGTPAMICIEDPFDPRNDVGRSSYGFPTVKRAFEQAYFQLVNILTDNRHNEPDNVSILSSIVGISDPILDFRHFIANLELSKDQQNPLADICPRASQRPSRRTPRKTPTRSSSSDSSESEAGTRVSSEQGQCRLDR